MLMSCYKFAIWRRRVYARSNATLREEATRRSTRVAELEQELRNAVRAQQDAQGRASELCTCCTQDSSHSPAGTLRHPCMLAYVAELSRVQAQYEVALSEQQALREDNERWRQRVQRLLDRHEVSEAILIIDRQTVRAHAFRDLPELTL